MEILKDKNLMASKPMLGAVSMGDYWIYSYWSEHNERKKDDIKDSELFSKSIIEYIQLFKSLPPKGIYIDNASCDSGKIKEIYFNGIKKQIWVYLSFE